MYATVQTHVMPMPNLSSLGATGCDILKVGYGQSPVVAKH